MLNNTVDILQILQKDVQGKINEHAVERTRRAMLRAISVYRSTGSLLWTFSYSLVIGGFFGLILFFH